MKLRAALGLTLLGLGAAAAQTPPAQKPPVFAIEVESVLIDAFATNDGSDITGLSARDFILRENGVPQTFDLLPTDALPIRAVLVFDTSASMRGEKLARLQAAAESFIKRLRPQDEAALISFADEIAIKAPLSSDLARLRFGLLTLKAVGGTSVYDGLFTALLASGSNQRSLVVLFSDGEDNMSWLGEEQMKKMVERSNALIHVVAAPSVRTVLRAGSRQERKSSEYVRKLETLAAITGGTMTEVASADRIEAAFTRIVEQMKNRYVLRFTPENPAPGWHRLDLRLASRKGEVRARNGYWVDGR